MIMFAFDMLVVLCIFFAAEPSIYLAKCKRENESTGESDVASEKRNRAAKLSYLFSILSAVAAAVVYFGFNTEIM